MKFVDDFVPYEQISNFSELALKLELDLEISWLPEYLNISAWSENIPIAFWLTKILKPNTFVELGTHYAVSYMSFCQAVSKLSLSTNCFAVDTWKGDSQAGYYDSKVFDIVNKYNKLHYTHFSKLLRKTFDEARLDFEKNSIDLLHIDGLHTYDAVKHDYETWIDTLSDKGVILFHDINVINDEQNFGVWKFWQELRDSFPSFTLPIGPGLGILGVGKRFPSPLQFLFSAKGNEARNIQSIFGSNGLLIKSINDLILTKQREEKLLNSFAWKIFKSLRAIGRLPSRFFSKKQQ
ncbi:MAG: class I SAM-dependent methyltransferase [Deltaproteobacteria bacterium]|jgi:hypothetical protein|nr:class I SAM-dependent methyltransferase [Deltaproteobacteria bacterium]